MGRDQENSEEKKACDMEGTQEIFISRCKSAMTLPLFCYQYTHMYVDSASKYGNSSLYGNGHA